MISDITASSLSYKESESSVIEGIREFKGIFIINEILTLSWGE